MRSVPIARSFRSAPERQDHPTCPCAPAQGLFSAPTGGRGGPLSQKAKPLTKEDDANVFMNKEFVYGADARANTGFGFWQMAWGSRQPLTAANYEIARAALGGMKGDYGRPLGIKPGLLVVPASLEGAANRILNSEYGTGGVTNEWKGTAKMLMTSWL
ncbi:MAG: Mu-like prophage major head subunit gpT family protein [Rhodobacteraceae bacterium]|nr:Mu-like prophage major head subunit gpT family protein [Paracoccaceae bacterium]